MFSLLPSPDNEYYEENKKLLKTVYVEKFEKLKKFVSPDGM